METASSRLRGSRDDAVEKGVCVWKGWAQGALTRRERERDLVRPRPRALRSAGWPASQRDVGQ